ncbi:MAG: CoA-transferase [Xanthobacteraceae bacterium]
MFDGATVMLGGFGDAGMPGQLIEALRRQGATNLVVDYALGGLFQDGRVRKLLASFPAPRGTAFRDRYLKGEIELELVPRRHSARDRTQCIRATAFWPKARG